MVGGELQFNVVFVGGEFWKSHDAGVINKYIQLMDRFVDGFCSLSDRVEVIKLDRDEGDFNGGVEFLDLGLDWRYFGLGSSKKNEVCRVGMSQRCCCFAS